MDLYEALGVRKAATAAEIRRAWQRKSRALHPALNPGDPVAAERYHDADATLSSSIRAASAYRSREWYGAGWRMFISHQSGRRQ